MIEKFEAGFKAVFGYVAVGIVVFIATWTFAPVVKVSRPTIVIEHNCTDSMPGAPQSHGYGA